MNMDKKDELKEYGWEEWTERIWMRRINWMNIDEKGKLNEYMNVKNEMNECGGEEWNEWILRRRILTEWKWMRRANWMNIWM